MTLSADLVDYIHRDPLLTTVVISVMASQARHVSKEVRTRIEAQLLAVAAKVGGAEVEAETREAISRAILAGLVGCTWWEPNGEARAASLARLFERLAESDSSPVFVSSGSFILGLCECPSRKSGTALLACSGPSVIEVAVVILADIEAAHQTRPWRLCKNELQSQHAPEKHRMECERNLVGN